MLDIVFIVYFSFIFFFLPKQKKLLGHHHPLRTDHYIKYSNLCHGCYDSINKGASNYCCKICDKLWHRKCIAAASELVNHPFHPNHALKLLVGGAPDYADHSCGFCQGIFNKFLYHCSTCNFSLDMRCGNSPQRVRIGKPKCHNHPLTLMARRVSFLCNACGTYGECNPYVCVACSFMVHQDCFDLPHVIYINRHDHRISHTYSLGLGNRICRVCRLAIEWVCGAYSCSKCPDFFVHSKCATRKNVWDGVELEGVAEEKEEEPMFKTIEEGVISHVKHPFHNLRLTDYGVLHDQGVRCRLCEGLVHSGNFYSCTECDYILHETCAYLPKRKRLGFSTSPLSLKEFVKEAAKDGFFKCWACKGRSSGYMYSENKRYNKTIDLRCATIDWSFDHECHPHTLFLTNLISDICGACSSIRQVLCCVECKFNLCYKCVSYPMKIKHRCDDHPLVLSFGDKEQHGTHWCTVCEAKIDLQKWFYECDNCGIVCHIHCILGDFSNLKPGLFTAEDGYTKGVVLNNGSTRPHCSRCSTRCLAPFIYSISDVYFCSYSCFKGPPKSPSHYARKAEFELIVAARRPFLLSMQ